MKLIENMRIALKALQANKLRAALTMLGIMIGVAAVITLRSIGDGVTRYVADQFIGLGTNLVFIVPTDDPNRRESSLTLRDMDVLSDPALVPGVSGIAPVLFRRVDVQYQGTTTSTTLRASTPDYGPVRGYEVARGRFMNEGDYNARSRVVILGQDVVDRTFPPDIDPLEAEVRLNDVTFRVIGILEAQGGGTFGSEDDLVIVPLSTASERLFNTRSQTTGQPLVDFVLVQGVNSEAIDDIVIDAAAALRQSHDISFRDEDDFLILTQQDFLSSFGEVTQVLTLFLAAIASISLLVGGIGIMNIMLVSVTERTREIGLRKAVGARYRDVLGQFLTEAVILAVLGGVAGIILGWLGAAAIHLAVPDLDTTVTWQSVVLAVGFSALVGLFFGIYPASRAAALNPIDALRFE